MKPETESAIVREVGLRDGLQSISRVLPTAKKIEWIRDAYAAGQREIEVGSFVPARLLPQLADTDQLVEFAKTLPGLCVSVLVPNLKGAERAIECGADLMLLPLSASRAHSLANLRKSPDDVVAEIARIRDLRDAKASKCLIEVGISTAFGCTLQGKVESAEVLRLLRAVLDAGVDRVGLADTVGYADPSMVRRPVRTSAADRRRPSELRPLSRHARTRHGERLCGVADGHHALRCVPGRHRRLPACAGRERQRIDRRRRLHVCQHGRFDRAGFRSVDCVARQGCAMA